MHRRAKKMDEMMDRKLLAEMRGYVAGQRFGIPAIRVPWKITPLETTGSASRR
jgi:hypothetical protein